MTTPAVLSVDLGTGSVKALVVDLECRVLASAAASYPTHRPRDGWAEQDPGEWWSATVDVVRRAVADATEIEIAAIGLSGQMHGTVLLDTDSRPVRPAIIWEDQRSAASIDRVTARVGAERLIELCGSALSTGFQAATLAWLVENEPTSIERTRAVLLPADYLRFRLTGTLASEPSGASSTLLFDIERRDWSPEMIAAVGIDQGVLPKIMQSTDVTGVLSARSAQQLGLPEGVPVVGGGGDAPLAALAADATTSGTLMLTISTGSQAILPAERPIRDRRGRIHTWCSLAEPGSALPAWYQMGATLASGRALRWLREDVLGVRGADVDSVVQRVPPGADGLLFLPYLNGERTPLMDPFAAGAFLGLKAHHGTAELTRSVLEGAVFALADAYAVLESLGASADRIVLAGGGARSAVWTQIVADVFALPVHPLIESEGSAMGAAIVAGAAIGWFDLADGARRSARFGPPVAPDAQAASIYRELHPIFQRAYGVLRDDLHSLADIASRARASSIRA